MNLLLLKLTAFALAAASGASAIDEPSYVLRGSVANEETLVEVESNCEQGTRAGRRAVKSAWSGRCSDAWDLGSQTRRIKNRRYPDNERNWRQAAYNECARSGADAEVKKIEKECLEDDPRECTDLGKEAADLIVNREVCEESSRQGKSKNYKRTCRRVAYGICKGGISSTINKWCPNKFPSTSKLNTLMNECTGQVNSMTGRNEVEFMAA